jgi:hypothetical protein
MLLYNAYENLTVNIDQHHYFQTQTQNKRSNKRVTVILWHGWVNIFYVKQQYILHILSACLLPYVDRAQSECFVYVIKFSVFGSTTCSQIFWRIFRKYIIEKILFHFVYKFVRKVFFLSKKNSAIFHLDYTHMFIKVPIIFVIFNNISFIFHKVF